MTTGTPKAGDFCWINMLTPQPAEARAFFGELLGWTYAEIPGMGHGVQVGGRDSAASSTSRARTRRRGRRRSSASW